MPYHHIILNETDSTNNHAKRLLCDGWHGAFTVMAKRQDAGRGTAGRSFASPTGGLYLTIGLGTSLDDLPAGLITCGTAVAVCEALQRVCGLEARIKWVNDLLCDNRKLCGILAERISCDGHTAVIVGIGINVAHTPPDVADIATSVADGTGRACDLLVLRDAIVARCDEWLHPSNVATIRGAYAERMVWVDRPIRVTQRNGMSFDGVARGIDHDGALLVEHNGRHVRVIAADITELH